MVLIGVLAPPGPLWIPASAGMTEMADLVFGRSTPTKLVQFLLAYACRRIPNAVITFEHFLDRIIG